MSDAPTSPRRDDEDFDAYVNRVESEILDAYEKGRFAPFALLNGPAGPQLFTLQWNEKDDVFFVRVARAAAESGATSWVGASMAHIFEAMIVLMWYVSDDGQQAHGLGQIYEGTVYTRVRSEPAKAPKFMQRVLG